MLSGRGLARGDRAIPFYATTFIFAALLEYWTKGTPITAINVTGMGCLIAGMFLMGTGKKP